MHPTPIFQNNNKAEALAFAEAFPFAMLAVNGENGPVTALVPLVFDVIDNQFLGHVAKHNPFWKVAQKDKNAVAIFRGPDAYISPSFYPSKIEHQKVVPTWNYMAVEIRGDITVGTSSRDMKKYLEPLTQKMESHRDTPWEMSDAPESYLAKLSNAIVGFSMSINRINFVEKLSQNKSEKDYHGVISSLNSSNSENDRAIAQAMKGQGN